MAVLTVKPITVTNPPEQEPAPAAPPPPPPPPRDDPPSDPWMPHFGAVQG